ncbi:glycosyltransferase family 2 protein [Bacillus sp. JJ1532]|uniref:glycosyltransferase n=1 Tax=unclassified Bacillus (in: firmicutes) TaxID=185979 RepID=UPI002FFFC250
MKISILIPIKLQYNEKNLSDFVNHIASLAVALKEDDCQIVIADESNCKVYRYINNKLKFFNNVKHFIPSEDLRTGDNDKLNGIYAGLNYVIYDKVLLIDDHYRITRETLAKISKYFDEYDCFKMMPKFDKFPFTVLIDMCGMFIINILDRRKQYCGHLAFRKEHISKTGFPNRDGLFDEFILEEKLRNSGYSIGFVKDASLEATQDIPFNKFLEQRVRYAYENLAMPFRFTLYALVLPIILLLLIISPKVAGLFCITITIIVLLLACIGQILYGAKILPFFTFLLSPLWFWFYPFTTWIAVWKYYSGGVKFGGKKVRKAK